VHSRVARIFYLRDMPLTGGCGGGTSETRPIVTGLKGVNHRYEVFRWMEDLDESGLALGSVDNIIDA